MMAVTCRAASVRWFSCRTTSATSFLRRWLSFRLLREYGRSLPSLRTVTFIRRRASGLTELLSVSRSRPSTSANIQQFYTEKLKTVSANSVIHYHAVIFQALKYAMKTDMVAQNVAMKVDRPRKQPYQPTFLDADEMQELFKVVKGTRLELPVLVAAFYGLRRGEVLGLKWDAIDFQRGTLTIKRTVTEVRLDGKAEIIEQESAKTKSSLRTLPLVGSFKEYFMEVKQAQEVNKKVCGNCYNYDYDGYVFVDELGERMKPDYLTNYFPAYIQRHGIRKMRFHDLRHSCASLLLANGVSLKQIQEWLGHSDFSTTANIYAHLDYTSKITSAQAMEKGMLLPRAEGFESKWIAFEDEDEDDEDLSSNKEAKS